jgi:hypothetical protein
MLDVDGLTDRIMTPPLYMHGGDPVHTHVYMLSVIWYQYAHPSSLISVCSSTDPIPDLDMGTCITSMYGLCEVVGILRRSC